MLPKNTTPVDEKAAATALRLLDQIEELDDVQKVYSNADFPESALMEYAAAWLAPVTGSSASGRNHPRHRPRPHRHRLRPHPRRRQPPSGPRLTVTVAPNPRWSPTPSASSDPRRPRRCHPRGPPAGSRRRRLHRRPRPRRRRRWRGPRRRPPRRRAGRPPLDPLQAARSQAVRHLLRPRRQRAGRPHGPGPPRPGRSA